MSITKYQIKTRLLFFSMMVLAGFNTLIAQDLPESSNLDKEEEDEKWYKPDHIKLQYAGSIGFISPGVGIAYAKDKMETDFYFGYLPKKIGGDHLIMLTLKNTYYPFSIKPKNRDFVIYPFSIGGFFNYTFGSEYTTSWPSYYEDGYYWWDSAIRLGFFIGGKITKPVSNLPFQSISSYYEIGSNDLYFISYIQNIKYFKPYEIFNLAIGIKMTF